MKTVIKVGELYIKEYFTKGSTSELVEIVLGYVDEAVLARVFYKKDENAWKASADGVVLYFENWKEILKNAVMLILMIVGFYAIGMGICCGLFMGLSLFSD